MRWVRSLSLAVSFAVLLAHSALAQGNAQCTQYDSPADHRGLNVCNAAIDGTIVFHPVAGLLVSGGNPVLGASRTLGGFPHVSLTARVNATRLHTPDLNYDGTTATVAQDQNIFAPAPLVEAAVGLFKGFNGLFSLDALGSAQLLPTNQIDNLKVDPKARKIGSIALGLGYGGRVGIFQGRAIIPAVSVSVMRRDIPEITYGDVVAGDQYSYSVDLHATNLRAIAGYKLALLNVSAGLGWDKYTGTTNIQFQNPVTSVNQTVGPIKLDQSRSMVFLDAALDLPIVKLGAEVGYQFGKKQNLATTFAGNNPSERRFFAGAGLRFSF